MIRLAYGNSILEKEENFEIVSITGTLSSDGVHIHIAVSEDLGNTIGGHLKDGCIVNTISEVCLKNFDNVKLNREYDESTGYDELVIYER